MLLLRFLRYIFGYVAFTAYGGFPERFINLCEHKKILIWDVRSNGGEIKACTDRNGYKKMRECARRSGMKLKINKKCGLPFFMNRHSRRFGVIIGICLCGATLLILSTRLWSIDVIGNERIASDKIIAAFEEAGVRIGTPCNRIDEDAAEKAAMNRLDGILWMNINIRGSRAVIEVRETVEQPTVEQDDTPLNIVAAKDGQIVIIRPFSGTQEQKTGTAVLKGELLISGMKENKDLTVSFCRAEGYVVARTTAEISASCKVSFNAEKTADKRRSIRLDLLTFSLPITPQTVQGYTEKKRLRLNGVTLPVGITVTTSRERSESEISLTSEQARLAAQSEFLCSCTRAFRYAYAENGEIREAADKNGCTVSGSFAVLENIGKKEPMEIKTETPQ